MRSRQNTLVAMTVQEIIDALEKVQDKSKLVTTGETGGTIIQVIDAINFVLLNKEFYGPINLDNEESRVMKYNGREE